MGTERGDKGMSKLYIAYGSNLNLEQMKHRCKSAKVYGKGMLEGYELLFKGAPGNAYLTIRPKRNSGVPVVVWKIKDEDELSLDRYEGYPNFYYKENIPVELDSGKVVEAMVYIMTNKIPERIHPNQPSQRYLESVREGYRSFGLKKEYIDEALEISKW